MLTGQHPRTVGVIANGVPLPEDAPSVARLLRAAGDHTALLGKAHFEPHLDPSLRFSENRCAAERDDTPWRGFDHVELAAHGPIGGHHYAAWLYEHHPADVAGFAAVLTGAGGGETGAPEVAHNPIPREHYHTDWVADRTIDWLGSLRRREPWFCWMSFPDPHHPFDPPMEEVRRRGDFRGRPLPGGHPGSAERARAILARAGATGSTSTKGASAIRREDRRASSQRASRMTSCARSTTWSRWRTSLSTRPWAGCSRRSVSAGSTTARMSSSPPTTAISAATPG